MGCCKMLEVKNITKTLGKKKVLDSVSLKVSPGEIVFLLGRSGVGKSVLLKVIVGILTQETGSIFVDGMETQPQSEELMTNIRKQCGLVFQLPALLDALSIRENLLLGLEAISPAVFEQQLKAVELEPTVLDSYPRELSVGSQKKVSIMRTLLRKPEYLLFDEPTTGLDPLSARLINQVIRHMAKEMGAGCLIVSHDVRSAIEMGEKILLLDEGKIVFEGSPQNFKTSAQPLAALFVKDTVFL